MIAREVALDGVRLHVGESGAGPAAILIHGLGAAHDIWTYLAPALAPQWRVLAVDLPGHGRSEKPDAPYTPGWYADVLVALAAALGVESAVVVGSSMGGRVALELAVRAPDLVRALVLSAPAIGFPRWMAHGAWLGGAAMRPAVLRRTMPHTLTRCFVDPSVPGAALRRTVLTERLRAPDLPAFARAVGRSFRGLVGAPPLPLERVGQPTLAVWGRADRHVPLAWGRSEVARLPHARLHVVARAAHLPMLERPVEFNAVVEEFLRPYAGGRPSAAVGG